MSIIFVELPCDHTYYPFTWLEGDLMPLILCAEYSRVRLGNKVVIPVKELKAKQKMGFKILTMPKYDFPDLAWILTQCLVM